MCRAFLFVREPFFIVGPTAVGKTEIAVEAAALCGAEIVSADAFQVYAGLARLTAKPSAHDLACVRHHLIGHVPRHETYSVARYHQEASACLHEVSSRGRPVIVVGGSGLYVKALTHGLSPLPPAQGELRAELERTDLPELVAELQRLDPTAARQVDTLNKRRVVRAVEVCMLTGGRFSDHQTAWQTARPPVRGVFLFREKSDLLERINRRTSKLLDEEALEEARTALRAPISATAARIIGLQEISSFLAGELTHAKCLERVQIATRRYAKRQMTWFRGETFDEVVNLSGGMDAHACARRIAQKIGTARESEFSVGDNPAET